MTLAEMAKEYEEDARKISAALKPLRAQLRACTSRDEEIRLKLKVDMLTKALTQTNKIAEHLKNYYNRSYCQNEEFKIRKTWFNCHATNAKSIFMDDKASFINCGDTTDQKGE